MPETVSLPLDKLPEYWKDEDRLNVLFAPFRNRHVNAKDWDTKLSFWKQSIYVFCTHNSIYKLQLDEMQKSFTHQGRYPMCLHIVFEELLKSQDLIPIENFVNNKEQGWGMWVADFFVKKPISWSFNKLKSTLTTINLSDMTLVHIEALKHNAKLYVTSIPDDIKNKVIEITELKKLVPSGNCTESFDLLLSHLQNTNQLMMRKINKNNNLITLVKFSTNPKEKEISDCEVDIYMLGETEKILLKNIESLEGEMNNAIKDAKAYLAKNHRQMAKTSLRKKHDLEKRIETKSSALYNVQTMLSRLEDSKHDAVVFDTYKNALTSIRNNFKENKLTEDSVTDTMIEIGEVLDIHNDIQETLGKSLNDSDGDLEKELELLMSSEVDNDEDNATNTTPRKPDLKMKDLEEQFKELDLPNVPDDLDTTPLPAL
ncbi:PREDICTED: charged multivesicular body protein 7 [Nicrophorus vespilloides]|uniref:Charged multivesicular body protein 7 n=1 Tax=Nicrophorus vespilloides TaxID=110193 RepID=A0ABM1N967_NICVS|nr:PREDICTED: charged multivesicular body protein 7 [Nicrophorus vespilloides]